LNLRNGLRELFREVPGDIETSLTLGVEVAVRGAVIQTSPTDICRKGTELN
jgi:hypothetical protein